MGNAAMKGQRARAPLVLKPFHGCFRIKGLRPCSCFMAALSEGRLPFLLLSHGAFCSFLLSGGLAKGKEKQLSLWSWSPFIATLSTYYKAAMKGLQDQRAVIVQPFHGCVTHFLSPAGLGKWIKQAWKGFRMKELWLCSPFMAALPEGSLRFLFAKPHGFTKGRESGCLLCIHWRLLTLSQSFLIIFVALFLIFSSFTIFILRCSDLHCTQYSSSVHMIDFHKARKKTDG